MSIIKLNNRALKDATAVGSITGLGNLVFISRSTASSSSSVSITSGLTSTYKEYIFVFNNLHPSSASNLQFQTSTNGGSSYGVTATTTFFYASHQENDGEAIVSYKTNRDHAQSTDFIYLTGDNMEGKCPWIGYDLFKDGAKDGTYTFHPDTDGNKTKPYWCFTES